MRRHLPRAAWQVVVPLLNPVTRDKCQVFGGPASYEPAFEKLVGISSPTRPDCGLSAELSGGGALTRTDGRSPTTLPDGGRVGQYPHVEQCGMPMESLNTLYGSLAHTREVLETIVVFL